MAQYVTKISEDLKTALEADYVVLGGGNSKLLKEPPEGCRLGDNASAFTGGFRLWDEPADQAKWNGGHKAKAPEQAS